MNNKLKWITMLSFLLPITLLPRVPVNCYAADFQRLHWLCNDYPLQVQGYVVEGWFQIAHVPGMEHFLQENLQITSGYHRTELSGGSVLSTAMRRKDDRWLIELQLISKNKEQIASYYSRWQRFADRYTPKTPVGMTVVVAFNEKLDGGSTTQIIRELAKNLEIENVSEIKTDQYIQLSGYSQQLMHKICVNGVKMNSSITAISHAEGTNLYIATPALYQQI